MLYDRKIRYLDYYRNGERIRNGGFAKTELQGDSFKMEITLRGIPCADREAVDVILSAGEKEVAFGSLALKNGSGEFRRKCSVQKGIDGTGVEYGELDGIRLRLSEAERISCTWRLSEKAAKEKEEPEPVEREAGQGRKADSSGSRSSLTTLFQKPQQLSETAEEKEGAEQRRSPREEPENRESDSGFGEELRGNSADIEEAEEQGVLRDETRQKEQQSEGWAVGEANEERQAERIENTEGSRLQPEAVTLLEDKWLQLAAIYPHIKPFQDEREYLSVSPADFVLFSAESYRAANNSFLLHGYYNYRHLILTRLEKRGEILYYVGVPGNYYDREKQVAVMFGFESFECAEEPAQNGDFGYYMMRVKL